VPGPYPVVVFGGRHANVPLDEGMGWALGRLVGTHQIACVVDVSDLGSASARRGFMTAFTEALYAANTQPLHLVFDEADLWAPQRAQPDGYDLLQRVEEVVRRGHIRGFVPVADHPAPGGAAQGRPIPGDILVSMKLTSSQDREAVGRWIEGQADRAEGRRILAALPRLARGEGWVWAPSDGVLARMAFPRIRTFDSSATPPRRHGPGASRRRAGSRHRTWRQSGRRWPGDRRTEPRGAPNVLATATRSGAWTGTGVASSRSANSWPRGHGWRLRQATAAPAESKFQSDSARKGRFRCPSAVPYTCDTMIGHSKCCTADTRIR